MKNNYLFVILSSAVLFLHGAQASSVGIFSSGVSSPSKALNNYIVPNVTLTSDRSARLFSNPFGLLGHKTCFTNGGDNFAAATGVCYNEVECLVGGGRFSAYCSGSPPTINGVCCVFVNNKCDGRKTTKRVSYFTNPKFPDVNTEPSSCQYRVEALPGICWVRFDFEEFELAAEPNAKCMDDTLTILNSPDGTGGKFCGSKKGFSTVVRISQSEPLIMGFLLQSPSYKWKIKISQIRCSDLKSVPRLGSCGETGAEGFTRVRKRVKKLLLPPDDRSLLPAKPVGQRTGRLRKMIKRRRIIRDVGNNLIGADERSVSEASVCNKKEYRDTGAACQLIKLAFGKKGKNDLRDSRNGETVSKGNTVDEKNSRLPGVLMRKRLNTEAYFPAFSTRDVFCSSKFRDKTHAAYKIIDGIEAPLHAFPWIVSLQMDGSHFCGGNLITESWVLTAAHCVDFGDIGTFRQDLVIKLAEHDITTADETIVVARRAKNIVINPRYTANPSSPGDLAMIKMDKPVKFSREVAPICLPKDDSLTYERLLGVAVGWGVTEEGTLSDVLRQVELNILPNMTCDENLQMVNLRATADQICTFKGPTGSESICSGDSGGPLMVREQDGKFVLIGAVSYSISDCTAPFPAVFTRITAWLGWISAVMAEP